MAALKSLNRACWLTPVIPALERLRQEDLKLESSLDYIVRPCLQKRTKSKTSKTSTGHTPVIPALVRWRREMALKVTKSSSDTQ